MNWILNIKKNSMKVDGSLFRNLNNFKFAIKLLITLTIIFLLPGRSFSQDLSEEQKQTLELKINLLLKDYEKFNQFTTDGVKINSDYIKQFIALFESPSKTGYFNDLAPSGKGDFDTPELYANFVNQFYKQGLDVTVNRDKINIVEIKFEQGKYKVFVYIPKKVVGIYNNQGIYKFNNELCFIFHAYFDEKGNITNLKINGIVTKDRYAQIVATRKGKGIYAGVGGMYAITQISDANINSSGIWNTGSKSNICPQFDLTIMFTRGFGIGTGIRLSKYQTAFTLSDYNKRSDGTIVDEDGDSYQPVLSINELIDTRTINSMDIPILLKFRMGKGKVRFALDMGMIYSMFSKANFTLEGSATRAGYYPIYNATLTDIPEYGFGTYNYKADKTYEMELPSSGMAAYTNLGLMFQVTPGFFFKIGSGLTYGFTPLPFNTINADNYFNYTLNSPAENSVIRSTGVDLELIFKLF